jgi:hypothetical protein
VGKEPKGRKQIAAPLDPLAPLAHQPDRVAERRKLIDLSTVKVEDVQWLVPDLIPLGSITVLYGAKAEGKSTISYGLTAHLRQSTAVLQGPFDQRGCDPIAGRR